MTAEPYRAIDLFAGIGGIRLGFDLAFGNNIRTVFVSEVDEAAKKTYSLNFKDPFEISGDITQIETSDVPDFDICFAGFPCQAFSLAGKRMGFEDDHRGHARGKLFFEALRICIEREHRPKVIFCENVKGLPIHDKGKTFRTIISALDDNGYSSYYQILNSKDFGVPQNRERIYIVAFRNDIAPTSFSFPTHAGKKQTISDILEEAPISSRYYLSDTYLATLRKHRKRHEAKGHGFGYQIKDHNDIANAVICGGMGRERNLIIDSRDHSLTPVTKIKGEVNKEDIRRLTPRECARLQGFPDSFKLLLADTHIYKQIGNSVTVPVIRAIAEEIKSALEVH